MPATAIAERPAAYPESALAALWSRAHALADALVAQDGTRFRVIYPGRQSAAAGPDFRDAALLTEAGDVVTGDVELHTQAPGWYSHGHHTDPNYNGVVLHVVFSPKSGRPTRLQSGAAVPVVALRPADADADIGTGAATDTGASAGANTDAAPPLPPISALFPDAGAGADICEALNAAGDARFAAKSRGFALEMRGDAPDEVIYRGLMDALGYAANRKAFRALALRVPYRALAELRGEPPATRLMALKAMLIGASGLMDRLPSVCPDEDAAQLRRLWRRMPKSAARRAPRPEWRLFRLRPANHPLRRVIGAARVIHGCLDRGMALAFADDLLGGGAGALRRRVEAPPHIGRGRARDAVVNIALPFLHAYAESARGGEDALRRAAIDAYAAHSALQENEITREARRLCRVAPRARLTARQQQGLIHLYNTRVKRAQSLAGDIPDAANDGNR